MIGLHILIDIFPIDSSLKKVITILLSETNSIIQYHFVWYYLTLMESTVWLIFELDIAITV